MTMLICSLLHRREVSQFHLEGHENMGFSPGAIHLPRNPTFSLGVRD